VHYYVCFLEGQFCLKTNHQGGHHLMPWAIFANFPNSIQSKRLDGNYTSRAEAEAIAAKYRRMLGNTVTVRVVWTQDN
jgi:hypothetical protein